MAATTGRSGKACRTAEATSDAPPRHNWHNVTLAITICVTRCIQYAGPIPRHIHIPKIPTSLQARSTLKPLPSHLRSASGAKEAPESRPNYRLRLEHPKPQDVTRHTLRNLRQTGKPPAKPVSNIDRFCGLFIAKYLH